MASTHAQRFNCLDQKKIEELVQYLEQWREKCRVRAISVGAIHHGQRIVDAHVGRGRRGAEGPETPNEESLYTISSLSKTFVSAAFGILIDESNGELRWSSRVRDHLDDFKPGSDSDTAKATFSDILRHSSGLDNPVVSMLGPKGKVILNEKDFMLLINDTPTQRHGESLYNQWTYSNIAYGLVVKVIEKRSNMSFSKYVQKRILGPLGMVHTAVTSQQVTESTNIVDSYAQMGDGSWAKLEHEWTDEEKSSILGMIGMRSCVKDMLIFVAALIDGYLATAPDTSKKRLGVDSWSDDEFDILKKVKVNPLKKVSGILDGAAFAQSCGHKCGGENHEYRHHFPWVKVNMPCPMLAWGSYNLTLGDVASEDMIVERNKYILGQDSPQRLAFVFNGLGFCGTSTVKFFPETKTIIVAFTNGLNVGDAADFAALHLAQEIFQLRPHVDINQMVDREVAAYRNDFETSAQYIREHCNDVVAEFDPRQYVGQYRGLGIELIVAMDSTKEALTLCFNHLDDLKFTLKPFSKDTFLYGPNSKDEWFRDGWLDWDHYTVRMISFQREHGPVEGISGVSWIWERGADPFYFTKITTPGAKDHSGCNKSFSGSDTTAGTGSPAETETTLGTPLSSNEGDGADIATMDSNGTVKAETGPLENGNVSSKNQESRSEEKLAQPRTCHLM